MNKYETYKVCIVTVIYENLYLLLNSVQLASPEASV
jgi:hypothetical protein